MWTLTHLSHWNQLDKNIRKFLRVVLPKEPAACTKSDCDCSPIRITHWGPHPTTRREWADKELRARIVHASIFSSVKARRIMEKAVSCRQSKAL